MIKTKQKWNPQETWTKINLNSMISRESINLWRDDALYTALQIAFKHVCFGQLLIPVGRQPDFGQRPTFTEDKVGVEHRPCTFSH